MTIKEAFFIPTKRDYGINEPGNACYLTANSIGLQPKSTKDALLTELEVWKKFGSQGHEKHLTRPKGWVSIDDEVSKLLAPIVGAKDANSVVSMASLTANIHLLLQTFYEPSKERNLIIMEDHAFPSDYFAIKTQVALKGFNPNDTIIYLKPRENEYCLRTDDIIKIIEEYGDRISIVWLPGVHFFTGQAFDIKAITRVTHKVGAIIGWDLAHAVGNLCLELDDWGVDFACWCSYKYLSSGPGGIGGIYINPKKWNQIHLKGWWGQELEPRLKLSYDIKLRKGAKGFQVSNPSVFDNVCLLESLKLFNYYGGMQKVRQDNIKISEYCINRIIERLAKDIIEIITPLRSEERGAQLTLKFSNEAVYESVIRIFEIKGIIVDQKRSYNSIRIAPFALYNDEKDIDYFIKAIQSIKM